MSALASASEKKPTNRVYRVAVIPGDGIGKEVVPEGVRVLETAAQKLPSKGSHVDTPSANGHSFAILPPLGNELHGRCGPDFPLRLPVSRGS